MTADEIRAKAKGLNEAEIIPQDRIWVECLIEIAAQLAELNERLKPLNIRDRTFEYPEGRP